MSPGTRCVTFIFALALGLPAWAQQTVGLFVNNAPDPGYTLFSPIGTFNSHLINNDGQVVRSWRGTDRPNLMAYLADDGNLVRSTKPGPGIGGRFEEYDWSGNLIWEYEFDSTDGTAHHDFEPMSNGNVLIIAWDTLTAAEAVAAGKNPSDVNLDLLLESIIEIQPTPPVGATIVWEWHAADHLIQDFDPTQANFGVVGDHPELIDINFSTSRDLIHANAVDYNSTLDQIVVSASFYDEIWVIDHSTTTAQAAGHSGGNSGKGGDLLYRWGNPAAYRRGNSSDQTLFGQHDAQWIDSGLPGAGNFLIFNNDQSGPGGPFSSVDEFVPPVDGNGNYALTAGQAYGPAGLVWSYQASPPENFYSGSTSGASRLPNGNTLATVGQQGRMIEVEPDGTTTWEYQNPDTGGGLVSQGDPVSNSGVFKARRYPPSFSGFSGHDLTPIGPLEGMTPPPPIDTGTLRADRLDFAGAQLEVSWLDGGCSAFEYHVLYGDLLNVDTASISGAVCDTGPGPVLWNGVPPGDLFILIVGTDFTGVYESNWGDASDGTPRGMTKASFQCGTTTKVLETPCP